MLWGSLVIDMQHFEHHIVCYKPVMFQHQMAKKNKSLEITGIHEYVDLKSQFFQQLKSLRDFADPMS